MSLAALLIAGSFASLTLAQRSARGARADALLVAAADYALNTIVASPVAYGLADLPYAHTANFAVSIPGSEPVSATVAATRIAAGTIWLVADASLARGDSARRRVNLIVRFRDIGSLPLAPLEARGNVRLARGIPFSTDGATDPDCARAPANVATGPSGAVTSEDSVSSLADPAAADSASFYLTAAQLAALDSAGALQHVRGDTTIASGSFDGIMVVDGTMEITGPWTVHGLVVSRGPIKAASGSIAVTGAMMSFAPPAATPAIDLSAGAIVWSPCGVQRALRRALGVRPARQRSWSELF